MKHVIRISILIAVIAAIIVANITRRNSKINGIVVHIDYEECDTLVSPDRIEKLLNHELPHLTTQLVKEVNTDAVSKAVAISPYIDQNEVSISLGRKIIVKATQRKPIVRVLYNNEEFYLDRKGHCFPISSQGSIDVIVANGYFKQKLGANYLQMDLQQFLNDTAKCNYGITKVWKTACFLHDNPKYGKMFDQISLEKNGDIILTPQKGNFVINMGSPDDFETKFSHLDILYAKALPVVGWDLYSSISLKFKNQIVCTKRSDTSK